MGTVNSKQSQRLLDPYIKITIGKLGEQAGDTFIIGDEKLIKASVTLGEGKVQSSCSFTVLDPDRSLVDKYFTYIEKVGGLDPVEAPSTTQNTNVSSISNSVIDASDKSGRVIFQSTKASLFNDRVGSRGNKLDPDNILGCAMRYNNPSAAGQFGSTGMIDYLKFGDKVKVTNLDNGKSVVCEIQDWGPNPRLADRGIDLFTRAFNELTNTKGYQAALNIGILNNVKVELIERATTTSASSNKDKNIQQVAQEQSITSKSNTAAGLSVPEYTVYNSLSVNMKAFLDTISYAEGAKYNTIFSGRTFSSYKDHPNIVITAGGYSSSAAGRYQFLNTTWASLKKTLNLPDFTPLSQDKAAAKLIIDQNAFTDVETGNFDSAIAKVNDIWASLPGSPYGQPTRPLNELRNYYNQRVKFYQEGKVESTKAAESTSTNPIQENIPSSATLAGSQIIVEMGYGGKTIAAYSFIHVGLKFSLFEPNGLEFTGQAASWVLTQRVKNTVYTNISFRKIAQRITSAYGMSLVMPEEGPTYTYFPQRGQTDYEALLIEARRIGYRVYTKGATLYIQPRQGVTADKQIFVLEYGDNMGTSFQVTHQAQKDSAGGARSSAPGANNTTGERKYEIDPDSGQVIQKRKENVVGTGRDSAIATTGSPIALPTPKTNGATDKQDAERNANENRIKGIIATAEFPTTPEALTLDPDTPFLTKGVSAFLDRMWVVDTVSHEYQTGNFVTKVTCYSPIKNKNASNSASPSVTSISNSVIPDNPSGSTNSTGFIRPTPGVVTSRHGSVNPRRPNHKGIDLGDSVGTPVRASAAGTISGVVAGCQVGNISCGGGYGNVIFLDHADGYQTRYAHLSEVLVTSGTVQQGQVIGRTGHTGHSTGPHLHFEIRKNGQHLNPEKFIKF